ncbi:MAG TPA: pyruvate dehydrogenase complex dihydrolipoamide acetyltransferase [Opitutae bacterium]|nr:pyruvate dehydrogenase complex dihydrolipoamide acetyltransferase [Opitutaceae bacterium]HCR30400.1 pyruvate dehydrogenase complex dihydrolipoamide acetyltransferase [Opitutae bacterium]
MATIIDMPKLSDTMTEGTVANWLKNEGDRIESGDVIAEIETDKATMELETFEDGILIKQIAATGSQIPVGSPIAAIGEEGETFDVAEVNAPASQAQPDSSPEHSENSSSQDENQNFESDPNIGTTSENFDSSRIKASPLARKLAQQKGIDLSSIIGTGPNGRILKKDVLGAESNQSGEIAQSQIGSAGTGIAKAEDIPVSQMRSVIAKRLQESKTNAPHFYLESEIEVGPLLELRKELNTELAESSTGQPELKISVNDFVLKAATEALRRVPAMNRSWGGKTIRQHATVDIAFGVAIEDGLLTPVIRNAEAKPITTIAAEAKELIGKARSKKLSPDEMANSTFTVTNLGMFGVKGFYGIINTPNAGILSVGTTVARPVVRDNGSIEAAQIMNIGLSCDHRVVDGVVGAQYLQAIKKIIEQPALMFI